MNGIKLSDVNYQAYKDHQTMKTVETPLTMMETFKETLKTQEHNYKGVDAVSQSLPSLKLNLDPKLTEAFTSFNAGEFNYLQSGINLEIENIEMMHLKNVKLEDLEKLGSSDEPRFHFIHYHYEYEGEPKSAKIFVYTVPGFKASIKARMIYSTCRSYLIDYYEKHYSRFDKKLEIDNINEITHESLIDEIHPVTAAPIATFSKPKRPGRV
ncbi:Twinfilin-2-A [Thelohanellus kitauei]|uniref:Twinfilin-2-A n=1 Tax=Thelohanellus kitauei TaxID=669202 RepID=A0A0C2MT03_THEKT|nr:Twinfilin-2-A [Thelohanellus kitauei]